MEYGELLVEVLTRCDIATLERLASLPEGERDLPAPLFGYSLGAFHSLLQEKDVIGNLCAYHGLTIQNNFVSFQLAFDKQYLFSEQCSDAYRLRRWCKTRTFGQMVEGLVKTGLLDFYKKWKKEYHIPSYSYEELAWPEDIAIRHNGCLPEYFRFWCQQGRNLTNLLEKSSPEWRSEYLEDVIHHQRWEYLSYFSDEELAEFCLDFPRQTICSGVHELLYSPYEFIPVEYHDRFSSSIFHFSTDYSRVEQLQIIRRARVVGYSSLRAYDAITLTKEEIEEILGREYDGRSSPISLLGFAQKHDCINFLLTKGLQPFHLVFLGDCKQDLDAVLSSMAGQIGFPTTASKRLYFEVLFLLHERYPLSPEQAVRLKRITFLFFSNLLKESGGLTSFPEYVIYFSGKYQELAVILSSVKTRPLIHQVY